MQHIGIRLLIAAFGLLIQTFVKAQDYTFSQSGLLGMAFNPSQAGRHPGDAKATLAHRSQWLAADLPYQSTFLSFEWNKPVRFKGWENVGLGALVLDDNLGQGILRNTWIQGGASASRFLDAGRRHELRVGVGICLSTRKLNNNSFLFENQFNTDLNDFDTGLNSGEIFDGQRQVYFQLHTGLTYQFAISHRAVLELQAATMGLNKRSDRLSQLPESQSAYQKIRTVFSASLRYALLPGFSLEPYMFHNRQGRASEWVVGSWFSFSNKSNSKQRIYVAPGAFVRTNDAFIGGVRFQYQAIQATVTYDATYSKVNNANTRYLSGTGGLGSMELSLVYLLNYRFRGYSRYPVPCQTI